MSSNYPIDYSYYYRKDQDPAKGQGTVPAAKSDDYTTVPVGSSSAPAKSTDLKDVTLFDKKTTPAPTTAKPTTQAPKKTGESVDERLNRYYSQYKNAKTPEEKEAFLEKYLKGCYGEMKDKTREEQIKIQLADFKKLLANTTNPDSYEMLAKKIYILESQNQISAAEAAVPTEPSNTDATKKYDEYQAYWKSLTPEQQSELRGRGVRGLAQSVQRCDAKNQVALSKIVVGSNNEEAIEIGAGHTSEMAAENQIEIAKTYNSAEISDKAKQEVSKILIDQYSKYAKENQTEIYKITYDSKFQEIKEYAAKNIYNLDKENQVGAVKYTVESGNEGAIKVAASQYNYYDDSVKNEIKYTITNSNYESAKITLAEAELKQESTSASQTYTAQEKIAAIEEQAKSNPSQIKSLVENLSDAEKISLLKSTSNPEIAKAIFENHPSLVVLREFGKTLDGNNSASTEIGNRYFNFIGTEGQTKLLSIASRKGSLSNIQEKDLNLGLAKQKYNELVQEQKKGEKAC